MVAYTGNNGVIEAAAYLVNEAAPEKSTRCVSCPNKVTITHNVFITRSECSSFNRIFFHVSLFDTSDGVT
jgi:hypothetical protein